MIECRQIHWTDSADQEALVHLLEQYMTDPMGEAEPLSPAEAARLVKELSSLPQAYVFFVCVHGLPVGYLLAFQGYSTFRVGCTYNIHDFFVSKTNRGKGLGCRLMESFIDWAETQKAVKITLEVRIDNGNAQGLYGKYGFAKTDPEMLFFVKKM